MSLELNLGYSGKAVISPCGVYRYQLQRFWNAGTPNVVWVCLNPSTADASEDDNTVRFCRKFSRSWGFSYLTIVNLFAVRATDPGVMKSHPAPIGPENDDWIKRAVSHADLVVAAWGVDGRHLDRAKQVLPLLKNVHCLSKTKDGHPRHPLYQRSDLQPIPL